ncbi:MAG TPA: serine--tRNA ligase [Bacillota bacterium]
MLDIAFIREHPEVVKRGAEKKRFEAPVDRLLEVDRLRREMQRRVEELRAEKNRRSKEIPGLAAEERQAAVTAMRQVDRNLKELEPELGRLEAEFDGLMLQIPNVPADDVPEGADDKDNVEIKRWGEPRSFDFTPLDHVALGEKLDIIDFARGSKVGGSRSYFLKNEGALLELACLRFAMDRLVQRGFVPLHVPMLVKPEAMVGGGFLPGGEDGVYALDNGMDLVGTAEVSLVAYHAGEILDQAELPKHYAGFSACFRREAGAAGKDTRGLYRVHQFYKIEQVVIGRNDEEESRRQHALLLNNSEELVQALDLPYRVVYVCGGDLGRPQVRKHDIETWMPSRGNYGETHSCSTIHEFQARRSMIRYRDEDGKVRYCHTLNNTALASPRVLIPILENYQLADGSVVIPEVLRPYLGGMEVIRPK